MSPKISSWIGLIGVAATIPLFQTISVAKTSVEIAETARAITVLITESEGQGSGVILQRQGDIYTVLTAAHVVRNKVNYKITTSDDIQYPVIGTSIRHAPNSIDLAVVKFRSTTNYPTAKLGNSNILKAGMDLYVAGFPAKTRVLTQLVFVVREGKVSANSNKIFEAGYSLVYSNDTLPGMSGGAVLNNDGELIAIHGRGDVEQLRDGSIGGKNGFNVGIPINRFATLANNMGVSLIQPLASVPQNTEKKADDRIALAAQKQVKAIEQLKLTQNQQTALVTLQQTVMQSKISVLTPTQKEQVRVAMQQGKSPNLTLTVEQKNQIKAIQTAALAQQDAILTPEQKQKVQEMKKQVASVPQNTEKKADDRIGSAAQNKLPSIEEQLKLTKEQQAKLVTLQKTVMQKKIAVLTPAQKEQVRVAMQQRKSPNLTLTVDQQNQLKAIQTAALAQQDAILTPEQKQKIQQMNKQSAPQPQR
jgi:Spy/CpxP family protein refolding chaperone